MDIFKDPFTGTTCIQGRSKRDMPVKRNFFKQRRHSGEITWRILLGNARRRSFHSAGTNTAEAWCRDKEVSDPGTRKSSRLEEQRDDNDC